MFSLVHLMVLLITISWGNQVNEELVVPSGVFGGSLSDFLREFLL